MFKKNLNLFISLMVLSLIPFCSQMVTTHLAANLSTDGLSIIGNLEWFDLANEVFLAFVNVPLYFILNHAKGDEDKFKRYVSRTFILSNILYIAFSIVVFVNCEKLVSVMLVSDMAETTLFLSFETIGFIFGNIVNYALIVFVMLEHSKSVYCVAVIKALFLIISNLVLIPAFGVNGAAASDILVNAVIAFFLIYQLIKLKLFVSPKFKLSFLKVYFKTGLFSGSQILLDNIIYALIVCRMVNLVQEQGNYWVANNIIWGLLLVPIIAMSEIVKKDCKADKQPSIKAWSAVIFIVFALWIAFIPFLNSFLSNILGISNYTDIFNIIVLLLPFYLVYSFTALLDSIMIGYGETVLTFVNSIIVNLVYYPAVYVAFKFEVFQPTITSICYMFGFGMVVHLIVSAVLYIDVIKSTK